MKYRVLLLILLCALSGTAQFEPFFGADKSIELVRSEETFFRKGKKEIYDTSQVLIAKGKTLIGKNHGKWKEYDAEQGWQTVNYKYGIRKSELRTTKGKQVKLLLGVGKPMFFPTCQEAIDKFKCKKVPVAGCMVNHKIIYRVGLHNSYVVTAMFLRYGAKWEENYRETCRAARQAQ